jgi:hypothetical protein
MFHKIEDLVMFINKLIYCFAIDQVSTLLYKKDVFSDTIAK